jgi:hypothetical protein
VLGNRKIKMHFMKELTSTQRLFIGVWLVMWIFLFVAGGYYFLYINVYQMFFGLYSGLSWTDYDGLKELGYDIELIRSFIFVLFPIAIFFATIFILSLMKFGDSFTELKTLYTNQNAPE